MFKTPEIRCPNCGYEGKAKRYTKGSLLVEIILWLCFLLPGFLYSCWRLSTRYWGCPECKYEHVVRIKK